MAYIDSFDLKKKNLYNPVADLRVPELEDFPQVFIHGYWILYCVQSGWHSVFAFDGIQFQLNSATSDAQKELGEKFS